MQTAHTLLARNGVAHRWIDTDTDPLGGLLVEYCGLGVERPVAVFADGSQLSAPVDFVEPDPERNDEEPEQAHAAEGRRIGMMVPARTPAQRAIAEALPGQHGVAQRALSPPRLHTQPNHGLYDVVVAGAGPVGLTAAVYASSEGLRTVVLERLGAGRSSGKSARTENYLGFRRASAIGRRGPEGEVRPRRDRVRG